MKRAIENKFVVDKVVGDVIVVDTGIIEGIGTTGDAETTGKTKIAGDNRSIADNKAVRKTLMVENIYLEITLASAGSEATLLKTY